MSDCSVDMVLEEDGTHRVSRRAAGFCEDVEQLVRTVDELGAGRSAVILDGNCLLVSKLPLEQGFAVVLHRADPQELRDYIDYRYGRQCILLLDGSYNVLGSSTEFEEVFGKLQEGSRISDVLDSASMMSFQGAFEDEVRGAETYPFTVRAADSSGRVLAQVVTLRRMPGLETLVQATLSQPSIDLADFSPAEADFLDTVMRNVPVPAIRVNREGLVTRANDNAVRIALETSARDPESTFFFDWVHPDERNKVISLHQRRISGHYAPFRYRVRLQPAPDITLHAEVTALQLPDETETLVFLNISDPFEGSGGTTASQAQQIAAMADGLDKKEDTASNLLDLLREAVEADGMAIQLSGSVLTSGNAPVTKQVNGTSLSGEKTWEKTPEGLYNLVIPVKHPDGLVNARFYGMHSNQPDPLGRLFLNLTPVLTDMIVTMLSRRSIALEMAGVISFFKLLSSDVQGLDELLEQVADVCGADRVLLGTVAGPEPVLTPLAGFGFPGAPPAIPLHADYTAGWAYTHQELTYVPNMALDERFSSVAPGTGSEIALPLVLQGRTIGALVAASRRSSAFGKPLPGLLQALSTALALRVAADPAGRVHGDRGARPGTRGDKIELEAAMDELSRRIRSALSTLAGYLDIMEDSSAEEDREALLAMSRASATLADHCENLLTFLRLEVGTADLNPAWSHPSELLTNLEPRLRAKAATEQVELEMELPQEPFTAFFDKARTEHVIVSLVDNAIRFNKPGGSVSVKLSRDGESWSIEVSDTGRGIPSSSLPYIYDRFYSKDPDGGGQSGLGIGLAVVKRFTEAMNGTISVWSREGKGTRFQVRLPVSG